jgi:DNA-binding CsgD family transcriptional regulator
MESRFAAHRHTALLGRAKECAALDRLVADVRRGEGRSLVLRGEAGIGKTALLEYLLGRASNCTIAQAVAVESEMELPFASLHQLVAPFLSRLERLPPPQRQALEVVFGLTAGASPDRLLIGLGVLSLLSEASEDRPLLCVIDDAQWLDEASAWTLAFVARRLLAEPVGLVLAARSAERDLRHISKLEIAGLKDADARALLDSAVRVVLDEQVRDRIVVETRGNPLALLELPRGLTVTELAGGFGSAAGRDLSGRISDSFLGRLDALSDEAHQLVLLAAAEPTGDPLLLWRAAARLGIPRAAADDAEAQGLIAIADRVAFRHPLVRSATYRSAAVEDRRAVHFALAEATDKDADPDRRAWHLAASTAGPDEQIALELERSAARAQARGGLAAAASFLERAVVLTAAPAQRADRALAAAEASMRAGALDAAGRLLGNAEIGPLQELGRARVNLLRGKIALLSTWGSRATPLLLKAAEQLERIDPNLAREAYLDAWGAALFAGRFNTGEGLLEVSLAARSAPPPDGAPAASDLLLDGLAILVTEGYSAAAAPLKRASRMITEQPLSLEACLRWGWLTTLPTYTLWDEERQHTDGTMQLETLRSAGALGPLIYALTTLDLLAVRCGDFVSAEESIAEIATLSEATGTVGPPQSAMRLAAFRGREPQARALIDSVREEALAMGQDVMVELTDWSLAVLFNGLGRYADVVAAARGAVEEDSRNPFISTWTAIEVLEAAARNGDPLLARAALERVAAETECAGSESALGILARSRALLSDGETADRLYQEATERLGRSRLRPDLARAHLLYGEWLRRGSRRVDARAQLRLAHEHFTAIGMEAFAERARIELLATGERVRKRTPETRDELTPQERQIATLARDGLSNPEIGGRMFLSTRTVEWHLRKVFAKLGIRGRGELAKALPSSDAELARA